MNKVAVILGAGPGIGYGVAERFGSEGFKIVLVGRDKEKLTKLTDQLNERGINTHIHCGNVGNKASLKKVLEEIIGHDGIPEMILYNAFKFDNKSLLNEEWDSIKSSMDVNVGGAFNLINIMYPLMDGENRGKLFFTGGGFSLDANPDFIALSMAKAALRNLVQAAYKTSEKSRVHIGSVIVDGFVNKNDSKHNPAAIAEQFWKLYEEEPDGYSSEIIY